MLQTSKMRYCFGVLVAFLATFPCQSVWAQANRATITGIVADPTGAVIPGADVTATNTDTNVATKTVSNNHGIYVVPNLFPGPYYVTFEKSGFKTVQRPGCVPAGIPAGSTGPRYGLRSPDILPKTTVLVRVKTEKSHINRSQKPYIM